MVLELGRLCAGRAWGASKRSWLCVLCSLLLATRHPPISANQHPAIACLPARLPACRSLRSIL